ncbi:hypothetical protein GS538_09100 [Rhodococcus hoagii]|nr:hypothetical protein [Prescottella equi]
MAKDFSSVTPQSATSANTAAATASRPPASAEPPASSGADNRRKKFVYGIGALAAILIVIMVVGLIARGGGDDNSNAPQTPHGPSKIVDGVPSGYTRDKGGAATAAVNFLQAHNMAQSGRLDVALVEKTMVAQNPTQTLTKMIDDARGRQVTGDIFTTLPATVTVRSLTQDEANVSIWALGSGSFMTNAAGDKSTVATWSTTDLHLVWADGDWKVQDQSFRVGPQPGQQNTSAADPAQVETGYYSFFIN